MERYAGGIIKNYTELGWTFNSYAEHVHVAKDGALIQLIEMTREENNLVGYVVTVFDNGTNFMTHPWSYEAAKKYFSRMKAKHNS